MTVSQLDELNPELKGKQNVASGTSLVIHPDEVGTLTSQEFTNLTGKVAADRQAGKTAEANKLAATLGQDHISDPLGILSDGEVKALQGQQSADQEAAKKDAAAVASDKKAINELEHSASGGIVDPFQIKSELKNEKSKLKEDLAAEKQAAGQAAHLGNLMAPSITAQEKKYDAADVKAAASAASAYGSEEKKIHELESELADAKNAHHVLGNSTSDVTALQGQIKADEIVAAKDKAEEKTATLAAADHVAAHSAGAAYVSESKSIKVLQKAKSAAKKAGNFFGNNSVHSITSEINKDEAVAAKDKQEQKALNIKAAVATDTPIAASKGSGQPGLGMAPDTKLSDYPGAHVSGSSGALVDSDTITTDQPLNALLGRFHENWAEFSADNPELAKQIGKDGTIPANSTVYIRADKYKQYTSSGGTAASHSAPVGGAAPSNASSTSSSSSPTPSLPKSHEDSTSHVQVVTEKAPENMPISAIYNAAGETEKQFLADNHEFRDGGHVNKGRTFEIRAADAGAYETNIDKLTGGGSAPAPSGPSAPEKPSTSGQPHTSFTSLPGPSTAVTTTPSGAQFTNPTIVGGNAAFGAGPAAAPPPAPAAPPAQPHTDSTSYASVIQDANLMKNAIPISDVYNAAGETEAQFLADNHEYNDGGTVAPGHTFEIRADNQAEYAANIGKYSAMKPGTTVAALNTAPPPPPSPAPAPAATPTAAAPPPPPPQPAVNYLAPSSIGVSAGSGGQPGLGMAPGTNLVWAPGVPSQDTHADSTSHALVHTEVNNSGKAVPAAEAMGGFGENWSEFHTDNTEFPSSSAMIKPGQSFEIRADKAFPGASTYDVGKL